MVFKAPDWRDEAAYPSHLEYPSLSFWAWQFLRRNKGYQKDWDLYVSRLQKMADRVPELALFVRACIEMNFHKSEEGKSICAPDKWNALAALADDQPECYEANPPFLDSETVGQWTNRVGNWSSGKEESDERGSAWLRPFDKYLGGLWGLERIRNPGLEEIAFPDGFQQGGTTMHAYYGRHHDEPKERTYRATLQKYHVMPIFDLRLPVDVLKGQFAALLEERKKMGDAKVFSLYDSRPERSLNLYRNYLRVLDATDDGEKSAAIARVLLPRHDSALARSTVDNWSKAAEIVRSETYHLFPSHSAIKSKKN